MTKDQINEAIALPHSAPSNGLCPEDIEHKFPALAERVRRITDEQRQWWAHCMKGTDE